MALEFYDNPVLVQEVSILVSVLLPGGGRLIFCTKQNAQVGITFDDYPACVRYSLLPRGGENFVLHITSIVMYMFAKY